MHIRQRTLHPGNNHPSLQGYRQNARRRIQDHEAQCGRVVSRPIPKSPSHQACRAGTWRRKKCINSRTTIGTPCTSGSCGITRITPSKRVRPESSCSIWQAPPGFLITRSPPEILGDDYPDLKDRKNSVEDFPSSTINPHPRAASRGRSAIAEAPPSRTRGAVANRNTSPGPPPPPRAVLYSPPCFVDRCASAAHSALRAEIGRIQPQPGPHG